MSRRVRLVLRLRRYRKIDELPLWVPVVTLAVFAANAWIFRRGLLAAGDAFVDMVNAGAGPPSRVAYYGLLLAWSLGWVALNAAGALGFASATRRKLDLA